MLVNFVNAQNGTNSETVTQIQFTEPPPKYEDLEKNLVAVISTNPKFETLPSYEEALEVQRQNNDTSN